MALQDLTPQLRTRLTRMETVMGEFIIAALVLLALGFAYYLYRTAEMRGWFEVNAPFFTYTDTGEGLAVGDPVRLMGFPIGRITEIAPMPPRGKGSDHNVLVRFVVIGTNYNYIWSGNSHAQFVDTGFMGKHLNISKGTNGYSVYENFPLREMTLDEIKSSPHFQKLRLGQEVYEGTNLSLKAWLPLFTNVDKVARLGLTRIWTIDITSPTKKVTGVWNDAGFHYEPFVETNLYALPPDESPAIMDRVQAIITQVQDALPHFLALTNPIAATLSNTAQLTSNLNAVAVSVRPAVSDLAVITSNLRDPHGSLGEWLIPTNLNQQLDATLFNANGALANVNLTLTNVNTNLVLVFDGVARSLENLADITSNLNHQVQVNSNILSSISTLIINSDDLVQGLKREWFLRSAFKHPKTNSPAGSRR
jgi:ABC-type transporter Mla subunit MlaD